MCVVGAALLGLSASTISAATVGFVKDFNAGFGGFSGGSQSYTLETGGVGGTSDAYLQIANPQFPAPLGVRSFAAELNGNLPADGVTGFSFWLKDVGESDPLEIHVGIGVGSINFWMTSAGFVPNSSDWTHFSVDITDPSQWTQTIGTGSFADALAAADRLLFRHDLTPVDQRPDVIQGDVGLDRITVLPEPAALTLILLAALAMPQRLRS